ncbi:hypothetical protein BN7_3705 [Wickerhamomyces ciferrii]|uniref:Uncharacterized protein n=1 Tax=Wickerhamomyces ciferrii (strain ATCC 14091 / BCRC 22168 / CBS 111 / JCM 3599 / NBRC 0793 / NRRL Y-1031 F-60-10) TaxID=1206466 RepID=K0KPQ7_WICCF|nr:uncharacterized protein BN7_3705 [Wickerhamomyces ciferrii]CCH44147.1 hypothetical protein BN7_3705 [Wickerhamomyces ciferrii]
MTTVWPKELHTKAEVVLYSALCDFYQGFTMFSKGEHNDAVTITKTSQTYMVAFQNVHIAHRAIAVMVGDDRVVLDQFFPDSPAMSTNAVISFKQYFGTDFSFPVKTTDCVMHKDKKLAIWNLTPFQRRAASLGQFWFKKQMSKKKDALIYMRKLDKDYGDGKTNLPSHKYVVEGDDRQVEKFRTRQYQSEAFIAEIYGRLFRYYTLSGKIGGNQDVNNKAPGSNQDDSDDCYSCDEWFGDKLSNGALQSSNLDKGVASKLNYPDIPTGGYSSLMFGRVSNSPFGRYLTY